MEVCHPSSWEGGSKFHLTIRLIGTAFAIEFTFWCEDLVQVTHGDCQHLEPKRDSLIATEKSNHSSEVATSGSSSY